MFSNWLWHRPLDLLIDAGEGLQLALGQKVWAPDVVAITHGGLASSAGTSTMEPAMTGLSMTFWRFILSSVGPETHQRPSSVPT